MVRFLNKKDGPLRCKITYSLFYVNCYITETTQY
jgi:hypothetical protein